MSGWVAVCGASPAIPADVMTFLGSTASTSRPARLMDSVKPCHFTLRTYWPDINAGCCFASLASGALSGPVYPSWISCCYWLSLTAHYWACDAWEINRKEMWIRRVCEAEVATFFWQNSWAKLEQNYLLSPVSNKDVREVMSEKAFIS